MRPQGSSDQPAALRAVVERIRRLGPISFEDYMELALYGDAGFFAGGAAGRRGHFLTSPEVGPLFSTVLARALDSWWATLGQPDPYMVVEAGAGVGTLAAGIRRARPACGPALRYVLVERSAALRAAQGDHLSLEPASGVLGTDADADAEAGGDGDDDDDGPDPMAGKGPLFTSLAEPPGQPFAGVVVANELLDNLPLVLLQRVGAGWSEVRVGEEGGRLAELLVPAAPGLAQEAAARAPDAPSGGRVPLQRQAQSWLRAALSRVVRGRVVVIDYAASTPALAVRPWREWLRTYRAHQRGGHPLSDPGAQDVTCEVATDQLAAVRLPTADRAQAEFLRAHGIQELVEEARASWWERAAEGDLEALRARSLLSEAEALTDPAGLGAFRVLEWQAPGAP